jgi:flagellar M-ring protein FliF
MRLLAIGGTFIVLFAFFAFLFARISNKDMSLLYGELEITDSSQIVSKIEGLGIPYQVRGGGAQIFVPSDEVDRLRLTMAGEGLPSGGSVGYEVFDKSEGFGTSTFVQNLNHTRALEGELGRTIGSIQGVRHARVHLVLGKKELFSRESHEPSASLFLKMKGQKRLGKQEILAIQHLVSAAVPSLKVSQISIVDDKGTLLARGQDDQSAHLGAMALEETKLNLENRLKNNLEDLLEKSLGPHKVWVKVTADLETERVHSQEEKYDPESKVARSTQSTEESGDSKEAEGNDAVTVQNNLPQGSATDSKGTQSQNKTNRTEETVNYEISKMIRNLTREAGGIKRLSVAVLVDGTYKPAKDAKGEPVYQARPPEEMKQIDNLVKTSIGFDSNRGDKVEVVNMKFTNPIILAPDEKQGSFMDLSRSEIMKLAENIAMIFVGFLVLLLVVRPILMRAFASYGDASSQAALTSQSSQEMALGGIGLPPELLALDSRSLKPLTSIANQERGAEEGNDMIDLKNIDGRVRAGTLKKAADFVQDQPEEAANVIRNWLKQEKA